MAKTQGKFIVNFEVTEQERDQIRENAAWMHLPVATFVRQAALGGTLDRESARRRIRESVGS